MPEMPRKAAQGGLPWGHGRAALGAWAGGAWRHGWAGRGATHSPHTVAHGGIAPIEPRHADDTP